MENGTKSPDIQKNEWAKAKVWIFSVWYNEKYKKDTSENEYNHCWDMLKKIPPSEINYIISNPELFFDQSDFDHLGKDSWQTIKQKVQVLLSATEIS